MYSITVQNQTGEYVLHNSYDEVLKLNQPVLSLELNKSGTLTFGINPDHPNRAQILPMASEIYVYDDDQIYWIGRPISIEGNFDLMAEVTCEGILGYLLDTQIPPFDFTGSNSIRGTNCIRVFLQRLIERHNLSVGSFGWNARKRFTVGTVTVTDSNNNLARSSEDYKSTLETINERLIETHGGFIRLRVSGSTRYIDYIDTFGAATQPITFGENILDLSTHTQAESIYTCVIPEGAQIGDTEKRVTLSGYTPTTSVRNRITQYTHGGGIFFDGTTGYLNGEYAIRDAAGEAAHGRIYIKKTWDDVTTQENLALKAAEYIGKISVLGTTIDLSAVDLSRIDVDYKRFGLGEIAQVISLPHDIQAEYQITQMNKDLFDPAGSSMVLGGELGTYTFDNTKQVTEIANQITDEVSSAVQNATALLSGGLGGYLIIRRDDTGQPYEILIMNAATESAATRCVRINQNGIGFGQSSAGSTSWTYRNAWTIDGNLVADFITTGTLKDHAGNTQLNMSTGVLTMKKGSINLGGGSFAVNDQGVLTMKKGSINLGNGNFYVNDQGVLTMKKGSINLGGGKFTVNDSGTLKAISGTIGGMSLSANALTKVYTAAGKQGYVRIVAPTGLTEDVFHTVYGGNSTFAIQATGRVRCAPTNWQGEFGGEIFYVDDRSAYMYNGDSAAAVEVNYNGVEIRPGDNRTTSAHSGNLYVTAAGLLFRANEGSSSRKIKHDIKPVENEELDPNRLYDVEVIQYKYNDDFLSEDDPNRGKDLIGFIVEDLDEIYPAAVSKEDPEESKTWTWSPIRMIPGMLQLIQDQKKEIDDLKERLEKVEHAIELLTKGAAN